MERGFEHGTIALDSNNNAYYAGQVVSGKLHFQIDAPLTFQAICIRFLGEATVSWKEYETEEYNNECRSYEKEYKGREEYFNFIQYIAGNISGPTTTLNPGTYSYPFQYQMPYIVPSSYDGQMGKIWYRVIAYIDHAGMYPNPVEVIKIYHVIAPLDLNEDSDAKNSINLEFEEIYSCCMCESEPLTINMRVPVSGFCPGQVIPIEVIAENRSNVEVQKMTYTLRRHEAFHSQQPKSDFESCEMIAIVKKGAIPCNTKRNFTVEVPIPDMIVPNLDNCAVIDMYFSLKVEFEVSGCNDGSEDEAIIILGLVPLKGIQDTNYRHPMADRLPQIPIPKPPITSVNVNQSNTQIKPIGFTLESLSSSGTVHYPGYPHPGNLSVDRSGLSPVPSANLPYPGLDINSSSAPSAPPGEI